MENVQAMNSKLLGFQSMQFLLVCLEDYAKCIVSKLGIGKGPFVYKLHRSPIYLLEEMDCTS
jgi:hypothetical protein